MKKQNHHFADKGPYSQSYGDFPGGQDVMASPSNAGVWVKIPHVLRPKKIKKKKGIGRR